mmetsp:Transcript_10889/g.26174  ORF Transcript_10889/g.26174 Transcript_10889/m.26174 type:complete len:399 (+) Transcript_10889:263-1459(+)
MKFRKILPRSSRDMTLNVPLFCCLLTTLWFLSRQTCELNFSNPESFEIKSFETQDYSFAKPRGREKLPDFTNGGIIVFYHNYKTGGSSIGKMLHELAQEDQARFTSDPKRDKSAISFEDALQTPSRLFFTMIRKSIDWEEDCLKTLDVAEKHKKLILLELHVEHPAPNFPSLVELAPTIEKWRNEAERRGVEFFAFTLLREPVAHALSFFNFFHVGNKKQRPPPTKRDHDYWNPFQPLKSNQKNFIHSYYENDRQCRMMNSNPHATKGAPYDLVWNYVPLSAKEVALSHEPCNVQKVYDVLFNSLDWVGTTEFLQNETLPLLTQLVSNNASRGRNTRPFKVFDENPSGFKGMKKADLSNESVAAILERTKLDRQLYAQVSRSFRLTDLGWDYRSPIDG